MTSPSVRERLLYVLPVTFVFVLAVFFYNIVALIGWTAEVDHLWRSLPFPSQGLNLLGYVIMLEVAVWIGSRHHWRTNHRWLLDMGSRRGLGLSRIPLDIFLALGALVLWQGIRVQTPLLNHEASYLLLPLLFAFVVNLLANDADSFNPEITELGKQQRDEYIAKHFPDDVPDSSGL